MKYITSKNLLIFTVVLLLNSIFSVELFSQNVAVTDDDSYTANSSAILDVKSNTKGLLIPRLTTVQREAINPAAIGLLVFDTDKNSFYYYSDEEWLALPQVSSSTGVSDALFAVKNAAGDTIFAVYNDGVKVVVPYGTKGKVGGFAVSGRTPTKLGEEGYLLVTPDSTRIFVNEVDVKGKVGGFAVSGRTPTKGFTNNYMEVTKDSTRIYITEGLTKGKVGGFAVSGRTPTKSNGTDYFNISGKSQAEEINNESRIMWYPVKAAFLAGEVHVGTADSVGTNSTALGYRTIAMGNYSQAMGFMAQSLGLNSTAIGNFAIAKSNNSFAFGDSAQAINTDAYSFGAGAIASGIGSYAFGSQGRDTLTLEPTSLPTIAEGNYSFAIGLGAYAKGDISISIGNNTTAEGKNSFALGSSTTAIGDYSTTMGHGSQASGLYSLALGNNAIASGYSSTAIGRDVEASAGSSTVIGFESIASGGGATAIGSWATASGSGSISLGLLCISSGIYSTSMGEETKAVGETSTSMGYRTTANGTYSTTIGQGTTADGQSSFAMGDRTIASGNLSVSMGRFTTAQSYASLVIGRYNIVSGTTTSWVAAEPLFVVGNGTSSLSRNNALTVLKNGNIGFGTADPTQKIDIDGQIRIRGGSPATGKILTSDVDGVGSWSTLDLSNISGTLTVAKGGTGHTSLTANKILVGNGTSAILYPLNLHWDNTNSRLGIKNTSPLYNLDVTGTGRFTSDVNLATSSGNVGIGTTAPAYKLDLVDSYWNASGGYFVRFRNNGGNYADGIRIETGDVNGSGAGYNDIIYVYCGDGDGTWVGSIYSHDGTLLMNGKSASPTKNSDIKNTNSGLNIINQLNVVDYDFNSKTNTYKTGFIGEDAIKVFPTMVRLEEETGEYGVANSALVPVLTKAIQEQQSQIEELKAELEELKSLLKK